MRVVAHKALQFVISVCLLLCINILFTNAFAQKLEWVVSMGSTKCTLGDGLQIDSKNNVIVSKFGCGLIIEKYNIGGLKSFQKILVENKAGNDPIIINTRSAIDEYGNITVAGMFRGTLQLGSYTFTSKGKIRKPGVVNTEKEFDIFVTRLDPTGTVLWAKHVFSEKGTDKLLDLGVDNSGQTIITGYMGGPIELYKTSVEIPGKAGQFFIMRFNIRGEYLSLARPEGITAKLRNLQMRVYNHFLYFSYLTRSGLPIVTKHELHGRLTWKVDPLAKDLAYLRAVRKSISLGIAVADEEVRLIGVSNKKIKLADKSYRIIPTPWLERLSINDGVTFFKKYIRDSTFSKGPFLTCQTHVLTDGSGYIMGKTNSGELLLLDIRPSSNDLKDHKTLTNANFLGTTNFAVSSNYELFWLIVGEGGAALDGRLIGNNTPGEAMLLKFQD